MKSDRRPQHKGKSLMDKTSVNRYDMPLKPRQLPGFSGCYYSRK